ncbi:MAG: aldolase/citrate lyase family protein [Gemmataceae bacterium]|nr:aldolase/citrate lyase family protein [Gemmataceae bacterium]MDW8267332.1 aldolase/citrate lyase family protein [Gemmataceae bacterium]
MGARLKSLLAEGKLTHVFGVGQLCHPKIVAIIGQTGRFDAVWIDQEHVGLSGEQIEQAALAARAFGLDSFVRLYATDYAAVMRVLEAGAGGIMAAQVRSAQEAEQIVRWAKFHPRGLRGVNGTGIDGRFGTLPLRDYFQQANAETFIAIQIEHVDALADVERIAAIPDVDVLFIGPADLTQSMGIPGEWEHPRLWDAIERVAAACRSAGIHWAILPLHPAFARRCLALGCRMLAPGIDVWVLQKGIRALLADYAEVLADA